MTKTQEDREKAILAAGNVKGVSQVNDAIKVMSDKNDQESKEGEADSNKKSRFYTVNVGDTLSKIAQTHYGDASQYPKIFEANQPMLKDPNKIYPGQTLRIP